MSNVTVEFNNRILMDGYGSVARCMLPLLTRHQRVPFMVDGDRSKHRTVTASRAASKRHTMQVAISVVAAVMWMMENPRQGMCRPGDLPHGYISEISRPYLGDFISTHSDWTPLKYNTNTFGDFAPLTLDLTDPWQFKNFLVRDRE